MQTINTGITEDNRKKIVQALNEVLASTYVLYFKTHRFHWNVQSPSFYMLHIFLEKQYNELFEAVDVVAERIRALGAFPPGAMSDYVKMSAVKEETDRLPAEDMLQQLLNDHETVVRYIRETITRLEDTKDVVSIDLLTRRSEAHEVMAWMLRSHVN